MVPLGVGEPEEPLLQPAVGSRQGVRRDPREGAPATPIVVLGSEELVPDGERELRELMALEPILGVVLTDAIADELGAIVPPAVTKPLRGPWRAEIQVPIGQPAAVSRIVAIAHDTLTRAGMSRYELVLTPGAAPMRPLRLVTRQPRRLQAA
jgi:hypothetical protein